VAATHPDVAKALRERLAAAKAEFAPYRQKEVPEFYRRLRESRARD
jgi:hypothetical protein